jgi:hypothetical protein
MVKIVKDVLMGYSQEYISMVNARLDALQVYSRISAIILLHVWTVLLDAKNVILLLFV